MKLTRDARHLTQEQQEEIRFTAIRMVFEEGFTQKAASKALGVDRAKLNGWCKSYEKHGLSALKAKKRGRRSGEQAKLQGWQAGAIVRKITDYMPDQLKLPFVLWTRAAIRDLIEEEYGITMSLMTMGNYLKKWGFTPQKPTQKAHRQNSKSVERWVKEEYPALEARAKKEGASIFWGDEGKVTNEIHAGKSYAPKGETPVVKKSAKRIKLNHISAITNKGEMRFMTYTANMTANKYILFLARLIQSHDRKIFFIADNLTVHHSKKVKAWVEKHNEQIELFYIPTYSPELNPDEYLNRDLKKNVHMARAPKTFEQLKENVLKFMHSIQKCPDRIKKYFNSRYVQYCAS